VGVLFVEAGEDPLRLRDTRFEQIIRGDVLLDDGEYGPLPFDTRADVLLEDTGR
jgi:hypothetical protein